MIALSSDGVKYHLNLLRAGKVPIDEISKNGYNLDIKNPHITEEEQTYTSAELLEMLHELFKKNDDLLNQLKSVLING